eukprot:2442078-Alexandrium_andersonii.AAC.1
MSASLVGSEMCIRDRHTRTWCQTPAQDSTAPPESNPPARRAYIRGKGPVSYTHLTLPTICSV